MPCVENSPPFLCSRLRFGLHRRGRFFTYGKIMAWFVVISVPVVLFTFAGVNTLLPGLHSYG